MVASPTATVLHAVAELGRGAARIGLTTSDEALSRFRIYLDTLLLWRRRVSLTAATTPLAIVRNHILDSLQVARFLEPGCRVADLGSGAGFPGIPLAIARPECSFVLVESHRKRANFLREVARAASLANVEIVEQRAEALCERSVSRFDIVVSRAVWRLSEFLEISEPLLKDAGLAIAMKGPKALAEVAEYHGPLIPTELSRYALAGHQQRVLVVYRHP